jgi:hypothetical protein
MKQTNDALKELYVACGGNSATVADMTIKSDIISALATLITNGGGARLPEVSASDNGDVLTVVEGAWAAAALPD